MTCDNNATATNEKLLEEIEQEWKEMWKDNPPKYEGKILIGGNEEGFNVAASISPRMYPFVLDALKRGNPEAFLESMTILTMKEVFSMYQLHKDDAEEEKTNETPEAE